MSQNTTPGASGQPTDPSIDTLKEILTEIRKLGTRLDVLEQRFEYLDRDVIRALESESKPVSLDRIDPPDTEREPPPIPSLALRSDGKVLLAVEHLKAENLEGRERWEGVVLSVAEACDVFDAVSDSCDDAASHVAGRILWHGKKTKPEPGEGNEQSP
jgi:hypothetical protein